MKRNTVGGLGLRHRLILAVATYGVLVASRLVTNMTTINHLWTFLFTVAAAGFAAAVVGYTIRQIVEQRQQHRSGE